MELKPTRLCQMIPVNIVNEMLSGGFSELQPDFMGFENNYFAVAHYVPKEFTIVDLGCYQAPQCYIFRDYVRYIGVDLYDAEHMQIPNYIPPERFIIYNTEHFRVSMQAFMKYWLPLLNLDADKTYYIMSAVPDMEATNAVFQDSRVKHAAVFYSGTEGKTKGICAEEILRLQKQLSVHKH